jgi:hypothetical protein
VKKAIGSFSIPSKIVRFRLYIHTLSDDERLRRYVRSISDHFGDVSSLSLRVQDYRIDTVSYPVIL